MDHGEVELDPSSRVVREPKYTESIRLPKPYGSWPTMDLTDLLDLGEKQDTSSMPVNLFGVHPKRQDYSYQSVNLFEVRNLLTPQVCKMMIDKSEKMGYKSIQMEYEESYRRAERVVVMCKPLADALWEHLRVHLLRNDIFEVRPYGFGAAGVWRPVGVNPCFRFTKYSPGDHFKPHKDGLFVLHDEYRSIYTIMAYLNDDFEGGETKFYETDASQNISPTTKRTHKEPPSYILKLAMKAKTGNVIVFNHDALHEGTPLVSGIKYIFRTDMIFQRISFSLTDTLHFLKDPEYHEAEKHYQNSIRLKCEGDPEGSTVEYLKGLEIQTKLSSIPRKVQNWIFLPPELWAFLISYSGFKASEVARLCEVSKSFFYSLSSGCIWKPFFISTFGLKNSEILDNTNEITNPWFFLYSDRMKANLPNGLIVDVGSMSTKFSLVLDSDNSERSCPSIMVRRPGHLWCFDEGLQKFIRGPELKAIPLDLLFDFFLASDVFTCCARDNPNMIYDGHGSIFEYHLSFILSLLSKPLSPSKAKLFLMRNYCYFDSEIEFLEHTLLNVGYAGITWLSPSVCALNGLGLKSGISLDIGLRWISLGVVVDNSDIFSFVYDLGGPGYFPSGHSLQYLSHLALVGQIIPDNYIGHKVQPSLHLIDWCRASHWTEVSNDEGFFPLYFFDLLSRESPPNDFMNVSSDNHDVIPKIVSILRSALDPKIFLNREEAKKVLVLTGGRSFFFEKAISEFLSEWNSDTKLILPEKEARSVLKLRGAKKMIINEGKQLMSFKKLVNHSDAGYREPRSLPENPLQPKKRCAMM
eukprot:TRINITY_DN11622_c0_g2_i8.p1 TRINITY_DN11622_c0_g2~~TRINITY_DN11622_c0_g2_i8.p1  ORF type:complete len:807 (+),score=124.07 TRINITY_DN11622_c0_g2_i8:92-2512(+)